MFSDSVDRSRRSAPVFALSFGVHAGLLLLLALAPATGTPRIPTVHSERAVILVAPRPVRALRAAPRLVLPRRIASTNAVVFEPRRRTPAPELAPAPSLTLRSEPAAAPPIIAPAPVALPKPAVATGVFASIPAAPAAVSSQPCR